MNVLLIDPIAAYIMRVIMLEAVAFFGFGTLCCLKYLKR